MHLVLHLPYRNFLRVFIFYLFNKMNVNVMLIQLQFVVLLVSHFYALSFAIIHSTFGHLRNGWGLRPSNHYYQCDGLKTSGSMISLGVESVVSQSKMSFMQSGI